MPFTKYWFSPKQKCMRDALGGDITQVFVNGVAVEYTQCTEGKEEPAVWNDFVLVAEGADLERLVIPAAAPTFGT